MSRTEALLEAGPRRLRPILMTTLSIIFALAPVVVGVEEGSELLKAAAVVLIGGLVTSTLLTLVFVPAMYTIFDDIEQFVRLVLVHFSRPRQLDPVELAILHPVQARPSDSSSPAQAAQAPGGQAEAARRLQRSRSDRAYKLMKYGMKADSE